MNSTGGSSTDPMSPRTRLGQAGASADGVPTRGLPADGRGAVCALLVVATKDSTEEQHQLNRILGWSPEPVAIPSELASGLAPGLANPGQAFTRTGRSRLA